MITPGVSPDEPAAAGGARASGDGGTPRIGVRVGDKERDEVTRLLHDAFAQGRITREELDERLDATLSARTAEDLRRVTADLPGAWPDDGWAGGPGTRAAWHPGFPSPGLPRFPDSPVGAPPGPYRGHGPRGHRVVARRHGRHPHPAMFLIPLAAIAVLAAGPMWPPFLVLKFLVIALVVKAVLGLAHHRRRHGYPGRR